MSIGSRLRRLLENNRITQTDLAKKLDISASTLNGYITDYREPDAKMLARLANELNTTVDYLINGMPPPDEEPYRAKVRVIAHNEGVKLTPEQEEAVTRYMRFILAEGAEET